MPMKVYLMAILDNYMFRPLLAIFRLSSRELKVLHIHGARTWCRDLTTCALNVYSRTLSSLEDNLNMARKGRNM